MSDLTWPDGISPTTGPGGLAALDIDVPGGAGRIYLQGAHVAAWQPAGADPVLWMSRQARYVAGTPLRGGVPICAPWFGPGRDGDATPPHGFFRIVPWRAVAATVDDGSAFVTFELTGADAAGAPGAHAFPADFAASYRVSLGRTLTLELTLTAGAHPLDLEEALHSYLVVSDAREVRITGLDGATSATRSPVRQG